MCLLSLYKLSFFNPIFLILIAAIKKRVLKIENLLTICIPVFNRYYLLKRLLKSIKTKYPKKIECVLVDDGSEDNLFKLVKIFRKIKILNLGIFTKNMGVAHAMLTAYQNLV